METTWTEEAEKMEAMKYCAEQDAMREEEKWKMEYRGSTGHHSSDAQDDRTSDAETEWDLESI